MRDLSSLGQAPPPGEAACRHVLYLDDDEGLLHLAFRGLERAGYQVTTHSRADKALADLRTRPGAFDILVTDVSMPHMSGYDLVRAALEVRPGLPVLMVSGYVSAEEQALAHDAGARLLVRKPDTFDELNRAIARVLADSGGAGPAWAGA